MSFMSGQADQQPIDALSRAMRRKPASSWVQSLWGGCAFCVGSAAGHIGCLVAPLLSLSANGATAASGHNPMLMIGSALAINSVTLGIWYRVRGRFVSKPIKLATIGFAIAGMASPPASTLSSMSIITAMLRHRSGMTHSRLNFKKASRNWLAFGI